MPKSYLWMTSHNFVEVGTFTTNRWSPNLHACMLITFPDVNIRTTSIIGVHLKSNYEVKFSKWVKVIVTNSWMMVWSKVSFSIILSSQITIYIKLKMSKSYRVMTKYNIEVTCGWYLSLCNSPIFLLGTLTLKPPEISAWSHFLRYIMGKSDSIKYSYKWYANGSQ